jgi:O-glycosyl hydrolase
MVGYFNSPPWWLTVSGCTSGSGGGTNNLLAGKEDRFAQHMCEVIRHYRDAWGVDFDRVSPINEPESDWWREGGGQDGCGMDAKQAIVLIPALERRLREAGLKARVQAFEAAFAGSLGYLDQLLGDGPTSAALAELTSHQYIADVGGLGRWPVRGRLHQKGVWQSEWGDWTNSGITLAMNYAAKLHEAHRTMQAEAWCMWEPGFLFDGPRDDEPNTAYYAVAQFSRFARPGMQAVECTDTTCKTTAYVDREARRLVIVTVNDAERPEQMSYDLSAFGELSRAEGWRTSETERLAPVAVTCGGAGFAADIPAKSVTTFALQYAGTATPLLANGGFETGKLAPWRGEGTGTTGVQDNYPQGGSFDAFVDMNAGQTGRLAAELGGLAPGHRYALSGACATSGIAATLSVTGADTDVGEQARGGGYRLLRLEFTAPADGKVTLAYDCGTATEWCWATLENVRVSPL